MLKFRKNLYGNVILSIFLISIASFSQIFIEFTKGKILDYATKKDISSLIFSILILCGAILFKGFSHFGYTFTFQIYKTNCLSKLREKLFFRWISTPFSIFNEKPTGLYISNYTNQIDIIEKSWYESIYGMLQIITEVIFGIAVLIFIHPILGIIVFICLLALASIPKWIEYYIKKLQNKKIEVFNTHINLFTDYISGFELIKNYGIQKHIFSKLKEGTKSIQKETIKSDKQAQSIKTFSSFFSQLTLFFIIFYVAVLLYKQEISVGMTLTAIAITQQLQTQVVHIAYYLQELIRARVAINLLNDDLNKNIHQDIFGDKKIFNVKTISFESVSFCYNQDYVIKKISWDISSNGLYLIRGESGSGKTTLVNLLMNYYKTSEGKILINGVAVENISNLMEKITIMRQDTTFLSDSLYNNLSMFQEIDSNKISMYLKKFNLKRFNSQEVLNQETMNLKQSISGGEARRLALIRTLLRQTDILILDEPFANLDNDTIKIIEEEIIAIKDRMVIVISHQISDFLKRHIKDEIYLTSK